jgi:hypothetical protein
VNQFVPRCPSSRSRISRRYLELANVLQMLPYHYPSVTEAAGASDCRERERQRGAPVHRRARHQARKGLAASFFECSRRLGRLRGMIQKVGMQRRFKAAEPHTSFARRGASGDN